MKTHYGKLLMLSFIITFGATHGTASEDKVNNAKGDLAMEKSHEEALEKKDGEKFSTAYFEWGLRGEYNIGTRYPKLKDDGSIIIPPLVIAREGAPAIKLESRGFTPTYEEVNKVWLKGIAIWAEIDWKDGTGKFVIDSLNAPQTSRKAAIMVATYTPMTGLAPLIPVAESLENQTLLDEASRDHQLRHYGVTHLMADKLSLLTNEPMFIVDRKRGKGGSMKQKQREAGKLFRILFLGDSLLTALDGTVKSPDGKGWIKNPKAESALGFNEAPPHLEYRNVPSAFYELLCKQKRVNNAWQGDIVYRRFSHPEFKYTGAWESSNLIEGLYPEYEKLKLPRFFDFNSPRENGASMEISIQGKRYVNVVYAKRFESGKFQIEVDGAPVKKVDCAAGLKSDLRYMGFDKYSHNDVLDCREQIDLRNTKEHIIRIVATDVSKPVRIWGIEAWSTPSFIVTNGGKSGMNVNNFVLVLEHTAKFSRPDLVVLEVSGNDLPYQYRSNIDAYSRLIQICKNANVPVVAVVPPLGKVYPPAWKDCQCDARTFFKGLGLPYIDMQRQFLLETRKTGKDMALFQLPDGHLLIPGIELFAQELLLPFLNTNGIQSAMFAGDTDWETNETVSNAR